LKRVLVAWSGGKDSAWMLHRLRGVADAEIAGLLTTLRSGSGRVAVHEVRQALLEAQARAAGLPVHRIELPHPCPNAVYEAALAGFLATQGSNVTHVAFGDLFLEDIRHYRERQFHALGIGLLFPLWGEPTRALAEEMVAGGLRAWITCVDTRQAPRAWAGRCFDRDFLQHLPEGVDPCGERGEFHTFAFAGPMFSRPIRARPGALSERDGFAYADLLPSAEEP
jgi:uncharacterized protein (TIGR00290 family)